LGFRSKAHELRSVRQSTNSPLTPLLRGAGFQVALICRSPSKQHNRGRITNMTSRQAQSCLGPSLPTVLTRWFGGTMVWGQGKRPWKGPPGHGFGAAAGNGAHFLRPTRVFRQPTPKPSCQYGIHSRSTHLHRRQLVWWLSLSEDARAAPHLLVLCACVCARVCGGWGSTARNGIAVRTRGHLGHAACAGRPAPHTSSSSVRYRSHR
jgi:hypothetical protein